MYPIRLKLFFNFRNKLCMKNNKTLADWFSITEMTFRSPVSQKHLTRSFSLTCAAVYEKILGSSNHVTPAVDSQPNQFTAKCIVGREKRSVNCHMTEGACPQLITTRGRCAVIVTNWKFSMRCIHIVEWQHAVFVLIFKMITVQRLKMVKRKLDSLPLQKRLILTKPSKNWSALQVNI